MPDVLIVLSISQSPSLLDLLVSNFSSAILLLSPLLEGTRLKPSPCAPVHPIYLDFPDLPKPYHCMFSHRKMHRPVAIIDREELYISAFPFRWGSQRSRPHWFLEISFLHFVPLSSPFFIHMKISFVDVPLLSPKNRGRAADVS